MVLCIDLPRTVLCGGGAVRRLGPLLRSMGLRRPLLVADDFMASPASGAVDKVSSAMAEAVERFDVFTDTITDPTTDSVERCVDALAAGGYDSVVALGGGSPIDTAKAAAMLHVHGGKMRDYKAPEVSCLLETSTFPHHQAPSSPQIPPPINSQAAHFPGAAAMAE